jgi:hypothetical protein
MPEPDTTWEEMMADAFSHLTEAQQVLERLAESVLGPLNAVMPCAEASHSVAVALVALAEAAIAGSSQDECVKICLLRSDR